MAGAGLISVKIAGWRHGCCYNVMACEGAPSTTHMRCPPSTGKSTILCNPFPLEMDAMPGVNAIPASRLGEAAGSSPAARSRVRAAQDLRPLRRPSPIVGVVRSQSSRLAAPLRPSSRIRSSPRAHMAPCHINSYPVAARSGCTLFPHARGSGLGKRNHS